MESSKKSHGETGCLIFTAVLPKKGFFFVIFPYLRHKSPYNWSRNLNWEPIPIVLGMRNLLKSPKNCTANRVARFSQQCCKKRGFRFILPPMCFNMGIFRGSGNLMK